MPPSLAPKLRLGTQTPPPWFPNDPLWFPNSVWEPRSAKLRFAFTSDAWARPAAAPTAASAKVYPQPVAIPPCRSALSLADHPLVKKKTVLFA
jgi:hypothetical protein